MHILLSTCLDYRHSLFSDVFYTELLYLLYQSIPMDGVTCISVCVADTAQTIKAFPTAAGRAGQGHPFR